MPFFHFPPILYIVSNPWEFWRDSTHSLGNAAVVHIIHFPVLSDHWNYLNIWYFLTLWIAQNCLSHNWLIHNGLWDSEVCTGNIICALNIPECGKCEKNVYWNADVFDHLWIETQLKKKENRGNREWKCAFIRIGVGLWRERRGFIHCAGFPADLAEPVLTRSCFFFSFLSLVFPQRQRPAHSPCGAQCFLITNTRDNNLTAANAVIQVATMLNVSKVQSPASWDWTHFPKLTIFFDFFTSNNWVSQFIAPAR